MKKKFLAGDLPERETHRVKLNGQSLSETSEEELRNRWNTIFNISGYHYDTESSRLFIRLADTKEKQLIRIIK